MNKQQIKFTCDQLDIVGYKAAAVIDVITQKSIPSIAEFDYNLPKATVGRNVNRVRAKWAEMREVSKQINNLDYAYEPPVLQEDIDRATKSMHEAIEQIDGYKESDFNCIEALKAKVLEEITDAFNAEFKTK